MAFIVGIWWQHVLGFEEVTVTKSEREGLTRAQYHRVQQMMATLTQQGRNKMLTGLMAYMAYLMGEIADLAREHMCTERPRPGQASGSRDPQEAGRAADDVLVEVDPETDRDEEGSDEEDDNMMTMQLWQATDKDDVGSLMQTFKAAKDPTFGMLMETFAVALQKFQEADRQVIAARMLQMLRDSLGGSHDRMDEQAQTLEVALGGLW